MTITFLSRSQQLLLLLMQFDTLLDLDRPVALVFDAAGFLLLKEGPVADDIVLVSEQDFTGSDSRKRDRGSYVGLARAIEAALDAQNIDSNGKLILPATA